MEAKGLGGVAKGGVGPSMRGRQPTTRWGHLARDLGPLKSYDEVRGSEVERRPRRMDRPGPTETGRRSQGGRRRDRSPGEIGHRLASVVFPVARGRSFAGSHGLGASAVARTPLGLGNDPQRGDAPRRLGDCCGRLRVRAGRGRPAAAAPGDLGRPTAARSPIGGRSVDCRRFGPSRHPDHPHERQGGEEGRTRALAGKGHDHHPAKRKVEDRKRMAHDPSTLSSNYTGKLATGQDGQSGPQRPDRPSANACRRPRLIQKHG